MLDAVINNGDRKGGHLLPGAGGQFFAIDHGVTFNAEDKLRTLLWGWAGEPLTDEALEALRDLARELAEGTPLAARLAELITDDEIEALRARVAALLSTVAGTRSRAANGPPFPGRPCDIRAGRRPASPDFPCMFGRRTQDRLSGQTSDPVRMRNIRPVRLRACMPGPLLRSPPCLARAAT